MLFIVSVSLNMDYDQEKIWRIVSNLLSNAIKYTPEKGKITFSVSTGIVADLNVDESFILAIKDTGAGIPKDQLPYIFDRYYQASRSDSNNKGSAGTGIGLALTKELISLLGGEIKVSSKVGQGTTFYVYLPITQVAEVYKSKDIGEVRLAGLAHAASIDNGEYHQDGLPIALIVEDNPDVTIYLQTSLEGKYLLELAPNGKIGIEKALEVVPDIIISDVMMPEVDGFELVERLKDDIRTSHIPIIMLTAKSDYASKIKGLKYGAEDYLSKPFSQEELEIRMKNLLAIRQNLHQRYKDIYSQVPATEEKTVATTKEDSFITNLKAVFEKHMDDPDFEVEDLCEELLISRVQLRRKVKALTGRSLSVYIRSLRLQKARQLLLTTDLAVKSVFYEVGFSNHSYFSSSYNQEFGETPTATRQKKETSI
ncbi:MAG: ATP-binding protein [Bacteroidota bacterium]